MMLKTKVEQLFIEAIQTAIDKEELGSLTSTAGLNIELSKCKNPSHGDRACNIAMQLAKKAKLAPLQIANKIIEYIDTDAIGELRVAPPGFINIFFRFGFLENCIHNIHTQKKNFGKFSKEARSKTETNKILLEFVSANPTGDLHIGHGRQAVLGSCLANLLDWGGYKVHKEFYINDAGVQIELLNQSSKSCILINEGLEDVSSYSDDFYPLDVMQKILTKDHYDNKIRQYLDLETNKSIDYIHLDATIAGLIAKKAFIEKQKQTLLKINLEFDEWYSEKDNLHNINPNKVAEAIKTLEANNYVYEEEGAKWFKAKDFGDERNRVLQKSSGHYTYLAADIAYHKNKFDRGFDKLINVWGADHHGQEPGIRGSIEAIGYNSKQLELVFIQMVSLKRDGTEVKMSKRSGDIVNIDDLYEEVGSDALRYFLAESQANNRMVFDLSLAKKQDKDNPVYYIQYAHARAASILRNLTVEQIEENIETQEKTIKPAYFTVEELNELTTSFKNINYLESGFEELSLDSEEAMSLKLLILELEDFQNLIKVSAEQRTPYKVAQYVKNLAGLFHQFYSKNRIMGVETKKLNARLTIALACKQVIANALEVLGISAPDKM